MPSAELYIIEYVIHGQHKSFIIRAGRMDNAEAWHWACCDAGIAIIPKFGRERMLKISKPQAERYGMESVTWRPSGAVPFNPKPYSPPPINALPPERSSGL
ncbi:hypothetical protein DYL61_16425 [Pseudomonas nabeulensis]|uniref:Uncharacterized protein n=1 Tax=Pseudomonas nabeulensis TaxID=2293833 RepID=A0A4Z0B3G3_9PSED|nr:DUF6555 family protein [Pseudomonas nabeulensis]TFY92979.1 hypothetical protein DYL61_16425 [Pseudomonas nabeulensis]